MERFCPEFLFTSKMIHWKMVKPVAATACRAKTTSLICTGFTPAGWRRKYSCCQERETHELPHRNGTVLTGCYKKGLLLLKVVSQYTQPLTRHGRNAVARIGFKSILRNVVRPPSPHRTMRLHVLWTHLKTFYSIHPPSGSPELYRSRTDPRWMEHSTRSQLYSEPRSQN